VEAEHVQALRNIAQNRHRDLDQMRAELIQKANLCTAEMAEIEKVLIATNGEVPDGEETPK